MKFFLPKIYPITDRALSGLSHAEQVTQFAKGGAKLVQLRDKSSASGELYKAAVETVRAANEAGVKLLINDRVDIAMLAHAHGVHLGQDDLPPREARKLLGNDAIIGVSTHTLGQVKTALDDAVADYLAFGPIFETVTKPDHEPLVGIEGLRAIRAAAAGIPLVAIGGINAQNLVSVFDAGADSAAMIGEFYRSSAGISDSFRRLLEIAECINQVKPY